MKRLIAFSALALVAAVGTAGAATETQVKYLSGKGNDDAVPWDFFLNEGRKSGEWAKIPVPSNWEMQGFGQYFYGYSTPEVQNPPRGQGKYRYDFTVPANWRESTVKLVFEGVMTDAEVKINGQSAGEIHQGSFYRFKYDITQLLKFGATNRLEVTVSEESANASVNRAERRGDYWNFAGIFRPVFLEALPREHIDWTAINAGADGSFAAEVHLGSAVTAPAQVTAQILDAGGRAVGTPFSAALAAGQQSVTVSREKQPGMKLWTAETPNMYGVRFTLSGSGRAQHQVTERFGFRTFEVRTGDGLYLNGQRIVLKGVNRHSFWPESGRTLSRKICYDDARLIKEMNMNAVRMSHYPPDREFLEACDELGLYVLDELAGWHGSYDTPTGQKLIGEMVRRDVNHPSILFWDNGNEGGWNAANDGEFAKWDPQARRVLHPQARAGGINAPHYPGYSQVQSLSLGREVFVITELLHGLYDGGLGVGLYDFWEVLGKAPTFGGGFMWALVDEGVVRTDEGNRVDSKPNLGPDGIVGPHREREGSFYTIRQIWSPIQVGPAELPAGFTGELKVENHFDFTNLDQCKFEWIVATVPVGAARKSIRSTGVLRGPAVAPHADGTLKLPLPSNYASAGVLQVTAIDPSGFRIWTSSWLLPGGSAATAGPGPSGPAASLREENGQLIVAYPRFEYRFNKESGRLTSVTRDGRMLSLADGPRFIAYSSEAPARGTGNPGTTTFKDIAPVGKLNRLGATQQGAEATVEATYDGPLSTVIWKLNAAGRASLDYVYDFAGTPDLIGVGFNYPQEKVRSLTWFGAGPYRVWRNRLEGGTFDIWSNRAHKNVPGMDWNYPEFQGYFRGWQWASFETAEGNFAVVNQRAGPSTGYLGVYAPIDGPVVPLLALPETGVAFLDVIPPMRDKGKLPGALGPQSGPVTVGGRRQGSVRFEFGR